ncbi:MAG: M48 family metalloprotease [Armatimonadota bacterium]|nr:MAG: M48 family metalloprotease [Armatimonadota bacterium]
MNSRPSGDTASRDTRHIVVTVLAAAVVVSIFCAFAAIIFRVSWKIGLLGLLAFAIAYAIDIYRTLNPSLPEVTPDSTDEDGRRIYAAVKQVSASAGIPMPRIYLDPDPDPNAYTYGFGPRHSVIVFHKGILDLVGDDEEMLRSVVGHEIGHMLSFDCSVFTALIFPIHIMTWVSNLLVSLAYLAGRMIGPIIHTTLRAATDIWGLLIGLFIAMFVVFLAFYLAMWAGLIIAAIAVCTLFVNLLKREREYAADAIGARLVGGKSGTVRVLARLLDAAPHDAEVLAAALASHPGPRPDGEEHPDLERWPVNRYVNVGLMHAAKELLFDHPYTVRRIGNVNSVAALGKPLVRTSDLAAWIPAGVLIVLFTSSSALWPGGASRRQPSPPSRPPAQTQTTAPRYIPPPPPNRAEEPSAPVEDLETPDEPSTVVEVVPQEQQPAEEPEPSAETERGRRLAELGREHLRLAGEGETQQNSATVRMHIQQAIRCFEEAVRLDPSNQEAQQNLDNARFLLQTVPE